MQLNEAIQLIQTPVLSGGNAQMWADLGCGSGLFSHALLSVLPKSSVVHAVDKNDTFSKDHNNAAISFHFADFEKEVLPFTNLDGILMANSLHYVADQLSCLQRLNKYLHPINGRYILVEYDSDIANRWVPFPLLLSKAIQLFTACGFSRMEKLGKKKSLYRKENIYACMFGR